MTIRAIVIATSEEEALDNAKNVFEDLAGDGKAFDYYATMDDPDAQGANEGIPAVALASSKAGKALIKDGMRATAEEFKANIARVRAAMAYTDEEIMVEMPNKKLKKDEANPLGGV